MNNLEKKFKEYFKEPFNIQLREKIPFLLNGIAHDLTEIAEKEKFLSNSERYAFYKTIKKLEKENTELKQQLAEQKPITRERVKDILHSNLIGRGFGNMNMAEIKIVFNQIATEILEGKEGEDE